MPLPDSAHLREDDKRRAIRRGSSRHAEAPSLSNRAVAQFVLLSPVGGRLGTRAVPLDAEGTRPVYSGDDSTLPLAEIVKRAVQSDGSVLMPSSAVGRALALLRVLQGPKRSGAIPPNRLVFPDRPMAAEAAAPYRSFGRRLRVGAAALKHVTDGVRSTATLQPPQRVARARCASVVIAASGVATGGRLLAAPAGVVARRAQRHRAGRLPGGRQPRRAAAGGRTRNEDLRRMGTGARRAAAAGRLLGPRRPR